MKPRSSAVVFTLFAVLAGCESERPKPFENRAIAVSSSGPLGSPIATFDHQVTGVAVSKDGRIFVNFPRWTEDAPVSVAEVMKDGSIKPYPNEEWNSWRNSKKNEITPNDHFVCVQSVVVDPQGSLWVVDPAAPATASVVPGGPKLVKIDLASNKVVKTIALDDNVAPNGSYMNDIRFSPDAKWGYLTDSAGKGGIVVVNLETGKARRAISGDKSTQAEKDVVVKTDGQPLRRPDGRGVEFASDSITISRDGNYLYWQPLTGKTFYRIPTETLRDESLSASDRVSKIEKVGETFPTDGLWTDANGRTYFSAIQDNAVKVRDADGKFTTLATDPRLRWPDSFSEGPNGEIYVTSSHIMDMNWYKPQNPAAVKTELWKLPAMR